MKKLYLVTRADLSLGSQAVQAAHALTEFHMHRKDEASNWYESSNTLALLVVPDEAALHTLVKEAALLGVSCTPFAEPDLNNQTTAVAIGCEGSRLTKKLDMALSTKYARRMD